METNQKTIKTTIIDFGTFPPPRSRCGQAAGSAHFSGSVKVEYVDGRLWRVIEPFFYTAENGEIISIPIDFICDFASIPRWAWVIVGPPTGCGDGANYGPAAIVHDFLCGTTGYPRRRADEVFREAMTVLRVSAWRKWVMWAAVRSYSIFGGIVSPRAK